MREKQHSELLNEQPAMALNSSHPKPWWMAALKRQNVTTRESIQRTIDVN
jgi:hypothetical protein